MPRPRIGRTHGRESPSQVDELFFELPMPPSANALYQRRRGGGLALSRSAKEFKEQVKGIIGDQLIHILRFPVDEELIYTLHIILYFDKLEYPGWFEYWEKDTYFTRGPNKGNLKGKAGEITGNRVPPGAKKLEDNHGFKKSSPAFPIQVD